jgi:major membrane immunogen (membrane-anchored lipoprotein)
MRKLYMLLILVFVVVSSLTACSSNEKVTLSTVKETSIYNNGVYNVQSEKDVEGYYCKATVTIKDDKIQEIDWQILDENNRVFDETYEEVFEGNEYYQEQCRNDLKGAKTYGPELIEVQDLEKVDAISGATWANQKFKEIIKLALAEAKK